MRIGHQTKFICHLLLSIILAQLVNPEILKAECVGKCRKLKKANVIGVNQEREYLQLSRDMLVVKNKASAKSMGYAPFLGCDEESAQLKAKAQRCAPVTLSTRDAVYYCPNQVKPFKNTTKAEGKGYSAYTACGDLEPLPPATPTPSPTPAVTPVPTNIVATPEAGERLEDLDAAAVVKLSSGSYRIYSAPSSSPFEPDTIYYADSMDGLTFGSPTAISGIAPSGVAETFSSPAITQLADDSFSLIYEKVRHISSAGVDLHSLMRAVSANGTAFSNSPATVVIPNGSAISAHFDADVVKLDASTQRMYYSTLSELKAVESSDDGATWGNELSVLILGNSDDYATYPSNVTVVKKDTNSYLLFFVSPADSLSTALSLYSAESTDGLTFFVHDTAVVTPADSYSIDSPNAVLLDDGSIRVYYVERMGSFGEAIKTVKSIIVDN